MAHYGEMALHLNPYDTIIIHYGIHLRNMKERNGRFESVQIDPITK